MDLIFFKTLQVNGGGGLHRTFGCRFYRLKQKISEIFLINIMKDRKRCTLLKNLLKRPSKSWDMKVFLNWRCNTPHWPVKARGGGSGVILACLAHMKVLFIADQPLFTELRYLYSFWSYPILKLGHRASLYGNMKGQKWPKLSFFSLDFYIFNLSIS